MTKQVPLVDYLVLGERPHLVTQTCAECGARYFGRRNACARCGRQEFTSTPAATTGRLGAFTIVHRAAKGLPVPFVSAIVDLADGARVQCNLVGVPAEPEQVQLGMPLRLTTFPVGTDDAGTEAVAFGFEPDVAAARA